MTDAENQLRFVCLRSQGWSFARIADELSPTFQSASLAQHPCPSVCFCGFLLHGYGLVLCTRPKPRPNSSNCAPSPQLLSAHFRFQFLTFSFPENCTISAPFCTNFSRSIVEVPIPQTLKKCTQSDGAVLSCKGLSFSMFGHKNQLWPLPLRGLPCRMCSRHGMPTTAPSKGRVMPGFR